MKQTVAAYIAKTLESAGVKRIWGVTGDSLNGLSDSLNRMRAGFQPGADPTSTGDCHAQSGA